MNGSIPILRIAFTSAGAVAAKRFVTPTGAQAGAGVNTIGVNTFDIAAAGVTGTVTVAGTEVVEAGGAIAAGAACETDANGRAITLAAGVKVARLAPGSSAAALGDLVEVIPIPN